MVPTSGSCDSQYALQQDCKQPTELSVNLTEESTSGLTEYATLNKQIRDLQQQNERLQAHNVELEKDRNHYVNKVKKLEISLHEKREQLWGEIEDLQDALQAKKDELQDVLSSRSEHRKAEGALREELGSLRKLLRDEQVKLSQATTKSSKEAKEVALLAENLKKLEKRLQQQNKLIRDQQARFTQVTAQSNERTRETNAKQTLLKETVEQLESRLLEQSKAFEEERSQLLQQVAKSQNDAQAELSSTLETAIPQLRSLLNAYDRVRLYEKCSFDKGQSRSIPTALGPVPHADLNQHMREERTQPIEQADGAIETQQEMTRHNLMEREGLLTCPITFELLELPVLTGCCGRTFSSEGLRQVIGRSPLCPFCCTRLSSTHPNRDMAKLVELHRRERSLLGMSNIESSSTTVPASHAIGLSTKSTSQAQSNRQNITCSSSTRQTRHRENRSDRTHARSEVPHRRSSRVSKPVIATSNTTSMTSSSTSSVVTTIGDNQSQDQSIAQGGLYISPVEGDDPPTRILPHMVWPVLSSPSFPTRSRAATRGRRSRSRIASNGPSTTASTIASVSHRRTTRSLFASSAVSSAQSNATISSATPSATLSKSSQSVSRSVLPSPCPGTSAALKFPCADAPTSTVSIGTVLGTMPLLPANAVPSAHSSATAKVSRNIQASGSSGFSSTKEDPTASMDTSFKAMKRVQSASATATSTTTSRSVPATTSRTAKATVTTIRTTTTFAPCRQTRLFASQDDGALKNERHESPRLAASQPAPRQPLRILAQSVISLEDLLGSDFESDSDSV